MTNCFMYVFIYVIGFMISVLSTIFVLCQSVYLLLFGCFLLLVWLWLEFCYCCCIHYFKVLKLPASIGVLSLGQTHSSGSEQEAVFFKVLKLPASIGVLSLGQTHSSGSEQEVVFFKVLKLPASIGVLSLGQTHSSGSEQEVVFFLSFNSHTVHFADQQKRQVRRFLGCTGKGRMLFLAK